MSIAATEPTKTPPKNEMRLQIPVFFIILLVLIHLCYLQNTSHSITFVEVNDKKNITIAFTGHRHYDGRADEVLYALLEELYREGYRRFLSGMSWGFDLAAAEQVVRLRQAYSDVILVAVEPFVGFRYLFRGADAERYDNIIGSADVKVCVGEDTGAKGYFARNRYLVEHSSHIVAWWNGIRRGGTHYTVKRALREGYSVDNLYIAEDTLFGEM